MKVKNLSTEEVTLFIAILGVPGPQLIYSSPSVAENIRLSP